VVDGVSLGGEGWAGDPGRGLTTTTTTTIGSIASVAAAVDGVVRGGRKDRRLCTYAQTYNRDDVDDVTTGEQRDSGQAPHAV